LTRPELIEALAKRPLSIGECDKCHAAPAKVFEVRNGKVGKRRACLCYGADLAAFKWCPVSVLEFYLDPKSGHGKDIWRWQNL
jgi:hypothetical protein